MVNIDDINDAEKNIDDLFKLRDELINNSPLLSDMKLRLNWYKKAINEMPQEANNFYSLIDEPIKSILSITPTSINYNSVTGATGSFYSVSGDTRQIIASYGSQHYPLITEYENLKNTENLIDEIVSIISEFREELVVFNPCKLLLEAKDKYSQWKVNAIENSDLAKEIRAFQDVFKGCLAKAWAETARLKNPDFSWNRMTEILGKNGSGYKKSLLKIKGDEERIHLEFTEILKKTKEVTSEQMETLFKEYIEHLYSIVNLIEIDLMK